MEKLIELLNEYEEKYNRSDLYYKFELENGQLFCYDDVTDTLWTMQDEAMVICSKKFGFIKWLVDNDKIDRERINDRWGDMSVHFTDEELFIMSLSISYTPIEDLVSYLKIS